MITITEVLYFTRYNKLISNIKEGFKMKNYTLATTNELKQQIIKREEMELLRLHLKANQEVPNHHFSGIGTAFVINGNIEFYNENSSFIATAGDCVQFEPNEIHALKALKESDVYVYRQNI